MKNKITKFKFNEKKNEIKDKFEKNKENEEIIKQNELLILEKNKIIEIDNEIEIKSNYLSELKIKIKELSKNKEIENEEDKLNQSMIFIEIENLNEKIDEKNKLLIKSENDEKKNEQVKKNRNLLLAEFNELENLRNFWKNQFYKCYNFSSENSYSEVSISIVIKKIILFKEF